MNLNDDLCAKSFALLCVAFPKLDINFVFGDQFKNNLYNDQIGKYQK